LLLIVFLLVQHRTLQCGRGNGSFLIDGYLNGSEKLLPIQKPKTISKVKKSKKSVQTSLFPIKRYDDSDLVITLRSADLDNMTPIQAFEFLYKLKKKIISGEK